LPSAIQRATSRWRVRSGQRWIRRSTGAATICDTDTLVIFKEGFDVPYGDGTQALPPEME
jgi:hypothetical protein